MRQRIARAIDALANIVRGFCPECERRRRYMARDPEQYRAELRSDEWQCNIHQKGKQCAR